MRSKKLVLLVAVLATTLLAFTSFAIAATSVQHPQKADTTYIALVNDSGKIVAAAAVPAGHPNIDFFTVNLAPDNVPIVGAAAKNCGDCHAASLNSDMTALIDIGGSGSSGKILFTSAGYARDGTHTWTAQNNADIIYTVFTMPASGLIDVPTTSMTLTALGSNDYQLAANALPPPGRAIMLASSTNTGQPHGALARFLATLTNDATTVIYPGNASFMASNLLLDNGSISPAYANGGGTVPRNPVPNMTASALLNNNADSIIGPMAAFANHGAIARA